MLDLVGATNKMLAASHRPVRQAADLTIRVHVPVDSTPAEIRAAFKAEADRLFPDKEVMGG